MMTYPTKEKDMTASNLELKKFYQEITKKRGRPAGVKNKPKQPIEEFKFPDEVNYWEMIAKKQEDRLKAYIAENEELAKICVMRWEEIQNLKYLITYLERKHENSSV
jgi:predicted RNA-binding Zn ribbon-like protein